MLITNVIDAKEKLQEIFDRYKINLRLLSTKPNKYDLFNTYLDMNDYIAFVDELIAFNVEGSLMKRDLKLTKSGGIAYSNIWTRYFLKWNYVEQDKLYAEILGLSCAGDFKIKLKRDQNTVDEEVVSGTKALTIFMRRYKDINKRNFHDDFKLGDDEKWHVRDYTREYYPPHIKVDGLNLHENFSKVHHIDVSSCFPAAASRADERLEKVFQYYYKRRKNHAEAKLVMNAMIGRTAYHKNPLYAMINYWARKGAYEQMEEACKLIESNSGRVLLTRTDSIWYIGADNLEWDKEKFLGSINFVENERNCRLRIKSRGAYEYIDDNGVYKPVLSGKTILDRTKPRTEWVWGDIYKCGKTCTGWKRREDGNIEESWEEINNHG